MQILYGKCMHVHNLIQINKDLLWIFLIIYLVSLQMHKVLIPYFLTLAVTPPTHSLEGTLLVSLVLLPGEVSVMVSCDSYLAGHVHILDHCFVKLDIRVISILGFGNLVDWLGFWNDRESHQTTVSWSKQVVRMFIWWLPGFRLLRRRV